MINLTPYILQFGLGLVFLSYIILAIFSVLWAIRMGETFSHVQATLMSKFLYWHGVGIGAVIIFSVAGSFIILFGRLILIGLK